MEERIEEYTFPADREDRCAQLRAAGYTEVPCNGQPLAAGTFRQINMFEVLKIRIALFPVVVPPCRYCGGSEVYELPRLGRSYHTFRCRFCSRTFSDSPRQQRGGNYLPAEKAACLRAALEAGQSVAEAAATVQVHRQTAVAQARALELETGSPPRYVRMNRACGGTTLNGEPCRRRAGVSGFCLHHDPEREADRLRWRTAVTTASRTAREYAHLLPWKRRRSHVLPEEAAQPTR